MRTREARPSEYATVGDLTVAAYLALLGREGLHGYETELRDVAGRAGAGRILVAVDDEDDTVIGAVAYVRGPGTPFSEFEDVDGCGIRMLAVSPMHQGRGAGGALTSACIALAASEGRRRIILHSTSKMSIARGLYERLGFARTVERDVLISADDLGGDEPLLLMAYVLELR